jgi:hypothetical protein
MKASRNGIYKIATEVLGVAVLVGISDHGYKVEKSLEL